ncbi:MAG: cadmium-translocating P-type ATPase [Rhodospirillales bacterium]|nr:cadmium-translocating P-type ATPase [Rhodospirillales bacterium]
MAGQALPAQQDNHCSVAPEAQAPSRYAAFVTHDDDGLCRLMLSVDGVHCAACIQRIESALHAEPAIRHARLNFSTGRLALEWLGDAALADSFAAKIEALGYKAHPYDPRDLSHDSEKENRFLLLCLGVAGFAAGNIMLLSVALWSSTGEVMGMAMRDFLHWIAALIAVPAIGFSGRPFFRSALAALSKGRANMDVPISLALLLTVGMSIIETFSHGEHVYFDSAVMLMFFLLVGRYLDFRARRSARDTASGLLSMMAGTATILDGGQQRMIPIRDIEADMTVLAGMGERIPADGVVLSGQSDIDTSLVTGESVPRPAGAQDEVYAGTMNMSAPLTIRVSRPAEESLLADIVKLMEQAEQGQARYVRIADRAARLYTPVVHTLAALAFLGWLFLGGLAWQPALMIAVTVLIITCPCALGLAVPVVQVLAIGRLMKHKIIVKSGDALERLAGVDTLMLDKTGTLTLGQPVLDNRGHCDPQALQLAASLAAQSRHPLARALAAAWDGQILALDVSEHPGQGLSAQWDGQTVKLGSRSWCGDQAAPAAAAQLELWLKIDGQPPCAFHFSDRLREDAAEVLDYFRAHNFPLYLVSGDRNEAVGHVAAESGIKDWQGETSPADKYERLQELRAQGRHVLMLGDGLNDAPVLAGADASMAPSTAIDMAQNAADIVFMGKALRPVIEAYETARFAQKLVKQNFTLAVLYNIVAVPLAVTGQVTPMIAALAMSGSSLVVIANSFRLRWMKTRKG